MLNYLFNKLDHVYNKWQRKDSIPEVTFIIKTFKRPQFVERLVNSIRTYYPHNTILICNDDKEPLKINGAIVYNTDYDIGVSAGRNFLVRKVDTDYFVLLDDDFVFTEETKIEQLKNELEKKKLDMVGGGIRKKNGEMHKYDGIYDYRNHQLIMKPGNRAGLYDFILDFFIAKTEKIIACPWDDELKIGEHAAFFFKHLGKLKIGYRPDIIVNHENYKIEAYQKFRRRAEYYIHRFMFKNDIKYFKNLHGTEYFLNDYDKYAKEHFKNNYD